MSGSRPVNGNRQRNLSVTSNTSSSSYKENSSVIHRNADHTADLRRINRSSRANSAVNANGARENARQTLSNMPFRDFQRPTSLFDSGSLMNNPSESEHRELREKMQELQQKKWQYENAMSQLQQMHLSFSDEPTPNVTRAELVNNEAVYSSANGRTRKLQEAQQRLVHLQELMQNVSLDLEYNPFAQHNEEKNNKPKEFPLDYLRNVSSHPPARPAAVSSRNPNVPRHLNKTPLLQPPGATHHFSPQNNLSHDSLGSPKRYSTSSQVNGSLLDVFAREPSFDSSNEDVEDTPIVGDEANGHDGHSSNEQVVHNTDSNIRSSVRLDRVDRIESQLDRTISLCELILNEQRRQALVTESLLSAVSNMQLSSRATAFQRNPSSFSLSGLPMNSSWNDHGSDFQILAQAVSQCCHMLSQLQRDLAVVQLSLESNPQHQEASARNGDMHHIPRSSAAGYDCMDRFDPQVTLNNRVPPGTRTNNYWDNFRSYSRQNLLSSGPSNVTVGEHSSVSSDVPMSQHSQHLQVTNHSEVNPRPYLQTDPSQPARRPKRKINKGQRQVEIGVHCPPHADNRALAYGLLTVRGHGGSSSNGTDGNARNLNPQHQATNEIAAAAAVTITAPSVESNPSDNNKVAKDTSTLKYSGARPKEARRAHESSVPSNVNLLAERPTEDKAPALESIVRVAMTEHATRPQFLSQLLELLHKFDSDPLREMALNALQDCVASNRRSSHHSELCKVFDSVVGHHRELTPNLLETFLNAVKLPEEEVVHEEGASAAVQQEDTHYVLRQALTPFLFRRLNEVHDLVMETLSKVDLANQTNVAIVTLSTASISGQEDDLAEADQSCDQSCDGMAETPAGPEESVVGLDEIPTRLMSVLSPPIWTSARSAGGGQSQSDEAAAARNSNNLAGTRSENSHWYPEDNSL